MSDLSITPHAPRIASGDLPGTGGQIGPSVQDFIVDEVPAYAAGGEGEHLYLRVRKTGLTTGECIDLIARASGVREREIGSAGMKDKQAVTSQWLSLPARGLTDPKTWSLPESIEILEVTRHGNKLRTGHLSANRFCIRVIDTEPNALGNAEAIAERLRTAGLYNYFGAQRFGRGGGNLQTALHWLAGNPNRASRFHKKLYPSVIQSEIFNRYLSERVALGPQQLIAGEVVRLGTGHSLFCVQDTAVEQPRYAAGELHLTGPLVGPKMKRAEGDAAELEQRLQEQVGLTEQLLQALGEFAPGTRRDLLVFPADLRVTAEGEHALRFEFTLPPGSYATQLIAEFTRAELKRNADAGSPR